MTTPPVAPAVAAESPSPEDRTVEDRDRPLTVSEVYGPTYQGEGASLGEPCAFVRLGRCNLTCVWCDTAYTWDWRRFDPKQELHVETTGAVLKRLRAMRVDLVIVTGGEPLIQHRALAPLLRLCRSEGLAVEIETNATIIPGFPSDLVRRFNCSPKLANSEVPESRRSRPAAIDWFVASGRAIFKFVVSQNADLEEVDQIVQRHKIPTDRVYIMPEGVAAADLNTRLAGLADQALRRRYRLTTRLHIQLWGLRRGV